MGTKLKKYLEREMTLKTSQLRDAIVFALCVSASSVAFAQDAAPTAQDPAPAAAAQSSEEATTLDRVEVTGSRISIPGLTTNSPVMTVDRAELDRTQPVSAEDFIKLLPAATPAIGPGTNNGSGGGATIDLRGLGSNRSLVLMDGRRVVPFNLDGVVDTNVIPVSLIQSVDLVTGGASAVYGADAVAGVVNFVLKRNFEGVEVRTNYGQSSRSDGARMDTSVTLGTNLDDGRGNVVLSLGKTDNDPLLQGARDFSEFNLDSNSGAAGGSGTAIPVRVGGTFNGGTGQLDTTTGAFRATYAPFNFNPFNYNQTSLDRWQATALARYEVNENVEAYAQMLYTRSNVFSQIAPGGLFGNVFDIGIGNPQIPTAARQQMCAGHNAIGTARNGDADPDNNVPAEYFITDCTPGSDQIAQLSVFRRSTELGTRYTDFQNKVFQSTVGARGNINDIWRYDAYWSHGEADQLANQGGFLSFSKTQQALLSTDGVNCVDPKGGCVPLNIWGPEGSISPASKTFLEVVTFAKQRVQQDVWSGNLSGDTGEFKSPWADYPIGLAFGLEGRRVRAMNAADAASKDPDEVMGSGGANPDISGQFTLREAYGEAMIPLVNNKPGMYALNLETGYRHSKFESGNTSTDYGSYKLGLEWAPIEALRFRSMFQRATRAPNVNELFQPLITGLDNLAVDPCQRGVTANPSEIVPAQFNTDGTLTNLCRLTGMPSSVLGGTNPGVEPPSAAQANIYFGGNPILEPEKADTQTIGFVWQPNQDLAFTVDYWKIEIEETISRPTLADVMNDCYDPARNPGFTMNASCQLVLGGRSTFDGSLNGASSTTRGPYLPQTNQGSTLTQGWDFGVRYGLGLSEGWGRLDFAVDATMMDTYQNQPSPISVNRECVGYYSVSCNTVAGIAYDWKLNQRAVWSIGDYEVGMNWRHLSEIKLEPAQELADGPFFPAYTKVPAYNYFDLSFAVNLPWNARVTLTVNNVADKDPPIVGSTIGSTAVNSGNTFPQFYDTLGRYYTLGLNWKF